MERCIKLLFLWFSKSMFLVVPVMNNKFIILILLFRIEINGLFVKARVMTFLKFVTAIGAFPHSDRVTLGRLR